MRHLSIWDLQAGFFEFHCSGGSASREQADLPHPIQYKPFLDLPAAGGYRSKQVKGFMEWFSSCNPNYLCV
jgi:hypothetical protein